MGRVFQNCTATNMANAGGFVTVRVPGYRGTVRAIAATEVNSPRVFLTQDEDGKFFVYCNSAPRSGVIRTTEFQKIRPFEDPRIAVQWAFAWVVYRRDTDSGVGFSNQFNGYRVFLKTAQGTVNVVNFASNVGVTSFGANRIGNVIEFAGIEGLHIIDRTTTLLEVRYLFRTYPGIENDGGEVTSTDIGLRRFVVRSGQVSELDSVSIGYTSLEEIPNGVPPNLSEIEYGEYWNANPFSRPDSPTAFSYDFANPTAIYPLPQAYHGKFGQRLFYAPPQPYLDPGNSVFREFSPLEEYPLKSGDSTGWVATPTPEQLQVLASSPIAAERDLAAAITGAGGILFANLGIYGRTGSNPTDVATLKFNSSFFSQSPFAVFARRSMPLAIDAFQIKGTVPNQFVNGDGVNWSTQSAIATKLDAKFTLDLTPDQANFIEFVELSGSEDNQDRQDVTQTVFKVAMV